MAAKCPLCGGKTVNSECMSCGYRLPDEDDISSLYNYDPSDYPQPQEKPSMPEAGYNYAEPVPPEPVDTPEIKVRENPYAENSGSAEPYASPRSNGNNGNPYANVSPYQPQQNGGNQQPYQNPYANGNFKPYAPNGSASGDLGSFFRKNWWLLLLSFFVPLAGIILFFTMKNSIDPKYRWLLIAAAILRLFMF